MENKNIEVQLDVHPMVIIKFHDEDGHIEEIDFSIIENIKQENNKTLVRYFTDWEDDPIRGFYIQESIEDAKELYNQAYKEYHDAYYNYTIVPNNYMDKVYEYLRNNLILEEDYPHSTETLINNLKQFMEEQDNDDETSNLG